MRTLLRFLILGTVVAAVLLVLLGIVSTLFAVVGPTYGAEARQLGFSSPWQLREAQLPTFGSPLVYQAGGRFGRGIGQTLVVIGLSLLPLVFLVLAASLLIRLLRDEAPTRRGREQENAEEGRMIQEMYHGFNRMDERVEALETILLGSPAVARRVRRREHRTTV